MGNGPDFSIHHGIFRGIVSYGHGHGIGLYSPHAAGRVDEEVLALEIHGIGAIPQCPDAAVNLKQTCPVMAQVHSTTSGQDQVLIFIGSFMDMDDIAIHGISSIEAYQPAVNADIGISFPDDQGIIRCTLDYQSIVSVAVRVRGSAVLIGLHRGTQGPAVGSRPVCDGDVLPHHIHTGNTVDQQPPFYGNGIGRASFRSRPANFHRFTAGIGIESRMTGIIEEDILTAYIQDRIHARDNFPVHRGLGRIFIAYLNGGTAPVSKGKGILIIFEISFQAIYRNGLAAL